MPRRAKPKFAKTCKYYVNDSHNETYQCGYSKLPFWVNKDDAEQISPDTVCNSCDCYKKIPKEKEVPNSY